MVVVVDELGYSVVVATGDHARRGFLGVDWECVRYGSLYCGVGWGRAVNGQLTFLLVEGLVGGAGGVASL